MILIHYHCLNKNPLTKEHEMSENLKDRIFSMRREFMQKNEVAPTELHLKKINALELMELTPGVDINKSLLWQIVSKGAVRAIEEDAKGILFEMKVIWDETFEVK